jgi:hypothetical protein
MSFAKATTVRILAIDDRLNRQLEAVEGCPLPTPKSDMWRSRKLAAQTGADSIHFSLTPSNGHCRELFNFGIADDPIRSRCAPPLPLSISYAMARLVGGGAFNTVNGDHFHLDLPWF